MNIPLLINLLVCDGWKDGIYSTDNSADAEDQSESTAPEDGFIFSAMRFVLMHSLRDMAAMQEKQQSKLQDGDGLPQNAQRMSRAVASSLPPTLSLLRRLISRPLLVESQLSTALAKFSP